MEPENHIYIGHRHEWGGDTAFSIDTASRRQHVYIIGQTGAGKSTLLRNLILQDIEDGRGVALIDPHGDLAADVLEHIPPSRTRDVVYFDPSAPDPLAINLFRATSDNWHLVASGIVSAFKKIWGSSWGPRLEYVLYAALAALLQCHNTSLLGVSRMLHDERYRAWVVFDNEDRITNSVNANGVIITNVYDNLNRVLVRGYPDGGVERFQYSTNGLITYTNQLNFVTHYGYDPALRKVTETNANLEVTQYSYDAAGDLLTLTDGKSQTTTWEYDMFGRVTNKLDAASDSIFVYTYDADNRLSTRWTPAKGTTDYYYDKVGNLTNVTYPVSPAIGMAYDSMNRLTSMVDAVGTTVYGYDAVGQLLSEDGPWADDTVSYSYNNRLRTGLRVAAPNASAWAQSYGYDSTRRMTNIVSPAGAFAYAYDLVAHQMVDQVSLPGGAYITNIYDGNARLLSTVLTNNGGPEMDSWAYTYNVGNQRTKVTRTKGSYVDYTYDNIGQLQSAKGKESGGVTNRLLEQFGYGYDTAHNLNLRTNNDLIQTFNVNDLNELTTATRSGTLTVAGTTTSQATSVTVNGLAAVLYSDSTFATNGFTLVDGDNPFTAIAHDSHGRASTNAITCYLPATVTYMYDSNGNLTNDGTRNFAYDDENQLISVWVPNVWRSDFVYDGKMRRRERFESQWNGSVWVTNTTVRYIYDGNLVIQERDGNNLSQVSYTRGKDFSGSLEGAGGIGGLLARTDHTMFAITATAANAPHAYYHADGNGNVTCLINSKQAIVAKYLYDPYGSIISQSGPLANANLYRVSSKEFHIISGLVHYPYRYYDVGLGRWQNRDPIAEAGFDALRSESSDIFQLIISLKKLNAGSFYAFVKNRPVNLYDPFGLRDCDAEHISCVRNCMQNQAPWPYETSDNTEEQNKAGRYRYCQKMCQEEYMRCLRDETEKGYRVICVIQLGIWILEGIEVGGSILAGA